MMFESLLLFLTLDISIERFLTSLHFE